MKRLFQKIPRILPVLVLLALFGLLRGPVEDRLREDLVSAQNGAITVLLALFDETFDESGVVGFDADNAEPVLRACAAVRLRLRERFLKALNEEVLESGDLEIESLQEPARKAFMCYLFLATIQELIIQHLDTSILDG